MSTLASVHVYDVAANRPAAGIAGRLFFASDTGAINRDNGATWDDVTPAGTFPTQAANKVLAGPTAGGAATPAFRLLVAADIPDLSAVYQPLDGDLTSISGASGTNTLYYRSAANTWSAVTIGSGLTFTAGTLSSSGGGGSDPISSVYPVFSTAGVDDEFDDGAFSGWTAVNDGSNTPTITEANSCVSMLLPGGNPSQHLNAFMKSATCAAGDYIELAMRGTGIAQTFNIAGLLFGDGTTYNAGNQIGFYWSPNEQRWGQGSFTGFNAFTGIGTFETPENRATWGDMFLRLKFTATNTFVGYTSPDGISWVNLTGNMSRTMTPSTVGFFCTTWGGSSPFAWSFRYFRKG